MALILSIESSSDIGSVAIHSSGERLVMVTLSEPRQHATKLAPVIESLVNEANIKLDELDAVAISMGPGSFTGLRIGVSIAKGICYALSKPLIAVDTLDVIAFNGKQLAKADELLCPMIDARRMEVYCKLLDNNLSEVIPTQAIVLEEGLLMDKLDRQKIHFFGDGSNKFKSMTPHPNASFTNGVIPDAEALGKLAYNKFLKTEFENLNSFEPFYLKDFFIRNSD